MLSTYKELTNIDRILYCDQDIKVGRNIAFLSFLFYGFFLNLMMFMGDLNQVDIERRISPAQFHDQGMLEVYREGALDGAMIAGVSGEVVEVFHRVLGEAPERIHYGLSPDCPEGRSMGIVFVPPEMSGPNLKLRWRLGLLSQEVMDVGCFGWEVEDYPTGTGVGRVLMRMQARLGRALGYEKMGLEPGNRGFWARIFSEASGLPQEQILRVLMDGSHREPVDYGPWHYDPSVLRMKGGTFCSIDLSDFS